MALSATQIRTLRRDIGDEAQPPVLSDTELNECYTRADGDEDATRVYALQQMYAQFDSEDEKGLRHLEAVLAFWQKQAGMTGGALRFGTISLGLDQEETTT